MTVQTRAAMQAQINTQIVPNGVGAIQAPVLNSALNNVVDTIIVNRGAWNSLTTYVQNDVVSYNGGAAILLATSNIGTPPSNGAIWQNWSLAGSVGPAGPQQAINPVDVAISSALPSFVYANGTAGVGATITASANGALSSAVIDGVTPVVGLNVCIWDYTGAGGANLAYGVYMLTTIGDGSTKFVFTRRTDADTAAKIGQSAFTVKSGAVNAGLQIMVQEAPGSITMGTTALNLIITLANPNGAQIAALAATVAPVLASFGYPAGDSMAGAVQDSTNRAPEFVSSAGVKHVARSRIRRLNDVTPESLVLGQKYGRVANSEWLTCTPFIPNWGQSRAESHVGGGNITLAQPGRMQMFGGGQASASPPAVSTTLYPALSSDPRLSAVTPYTTNSVFPVNDGENPAFGLGFLYELLGKENGLGWADIALQLVSVNNNRGSTAIAALSKGTLMYNSSLTQAVALQTQALANGWRARTMGAAWTQGDADANQTKAYYMGKLQQLANDWASDTVTGGSPAFPGQTIVPHIVTSANCSTGAGTNFYSTPRAQLQCAVDFFTGASTAPVGFSTPEYFLNHCFDASGVHVDARSANLLGSYVALYLKRVFIDGLTWAPMYPIAQRREGNLLAMQMRMRDPRCKLVIANSTGPMFSHPDYDTLPPQPNAGWKVLNGSTDVLNSVSVCDDWILFNLSTPPVDGFNPNYGLQTPVNMYPYIGPAGNMRDDHGRFVRSDLANAPIHNWVPPMSCVLGSSGSGISLV